jgi:predicted hydrocarbon binding protein
MQTELTLLVQSRTAAVSAQIAITLMQHGYQIDAQQYNALHDGDQSRLKLRISGSAADRAKLYEVVSDIPGVLAIEDNASGPELVSAEDLDSQILDTVSLLLIAEFPDILRPLQEFEQGLDAALRAPMLFALGERVGRALGRVHGSARNGSATSVAAALTGPVQRALRPLTVARPEGEGYALPQCPMAAGSTASGGVGCSFLTGFIKGVFASLSLTTKITKVGCRARGDGPCRFDVRGLS